ncbi:hypothetical protein H0H93_012043 [Arthromyces matolae]|nr:hypothetical protein H0H93_012043 [Arthromyces matolae]
MKGESDNEILLAALVNESRWTDAIQIKEIERPQSWRLVRLDTDNVVTEEELVFTVYGVIKAMDLLPFKMNAKLSGKRIKYLKQSVQLEGLGTKQFEDAVRAASIVCNHFASEFAEGRLEQWEDAYAGHQEKYLNIANRIFTPVDELGPDEVHQPLPKELDPYNVTDKVVQKGFAVTEDNTVQYSRATSETKDGLVVRRRVNLHDARTPLY